MSDEVFEENNASPSFKHDCKIQSRNRLSPPFIIDPPGLEDSLDDDRRRCFLTAAVVS